MEPKEINSLTESFYSSYKDIAYEGGFGFFTKLAHKRIEAGRKKSETYDSVLELGVGTGQHLEFVRHAYDKYSGVDVLLPKISERNPKIHYVLSSAESLDFASNSIDRVISFCVLHHIPNLELALEEIRRVVKHGGVVDLYVPCDPGLIYRWIRHWVSHKKTARALDISMLETKFLWAIEHRGHFLGIKSMICWVFRNDSVKEVRFPLPFLSWNGNLFSVFRIQISKS